MNLGWCITSKLHDCHERWREVVSWPTGTQTIIATSVLCKTYTPGPSWWQGQGSSLNFGEWMEIFRINKWCMCGLVDLNWAVKDSIEGSYPIWYHLSIKILLTLFLPLGSDNLAKFGSDQTPDSLHSLAHEFYLLGMPISWTINLQ